MLKKSKKFISFYIREEQYAIKSSLVNKFIEFEDFTAVPQSSADIFGLIYHNGHIITIFDLHRILKIKKFGDSIKRTALIFEYDGYYYGILIDQGGLVINNQRIFNDNQKTEFKTYIKTNNKKKVYILEVDELLAQLNIYD